MNIVKADGLDFDGVDFIPKELTINLAVEGSVTGAGKPITLRAAKAMVDGYLLPIVDNINRLGKDSDEAQKLLDSNIAVFFGKETLMLLLSQTDCEGIRFYFCKNHEKKQSLVLVGVDGGKQDLGLQGKSKSIIDPSLNINEIQEDIMVDEVGGPKSLRDHLNNSKLIGDPVGEALEKYLV